MINYYECTQLDGEVVTLATDLVKDRQWMEQNTTGWTPWMHHVVTTSPAAQYGGTRVPASTWLHGMARVDLSFCCRIVHRQTDSDAMISDRLEIEREMREAAR